MLKITFQTLVSKLRFDIILPVFIICILGLLFINDNTTIKILGDEFGYWTAAAWLTGKDWSEVAALNSYYGYGYGLLLALIIQLPLSPIIKYKFAIVLNVLMLIAVYFIIYYFVNKFQLSKYKYISSLIALTPVLYVGNLFHSQFTMTETILMFLFWLFILLLYSVNTHYASYKVILGSFLLVYLYITHHRTLGVIFVGTLCLLYIQIKQKNFRSALLFLVMTAGLMIGSECLKNYYQDTYLVSEYSNQLFYNDYSGQISRVKSTFTLKGFQNLCIGMVGKIFYICSSSYLLAEIAIFSLIQNIYKSIKNRRLSSNGIVEIFVLLSVAASVLISAVFLIDYTTRFDLLYYGRYNEFLISVLILLGLIVLIKTDFITPPKITVMYVIYSIMTLIVHTKVPGKNVVDLTLASATGVYDTISKYDQNILSIGIKSILINLIVVIFICILKKRNKKTFIIYTCILLSACWIKTYTYNYSVGLLSWAIPAEQKEQMIANLILRKNSESDIYYYATEGNNIDFLQFLIEDIPIRCLYNKDDLESLPPNSYLVTELSTELNETYDLQNYNKIINSNRLILWQRSK